MHPRGRLDELPPLARTGIGGLPFTTSEDALAYAWGNELPYVPELSDERIGQNPMALKCLEGALERVRRERLPLLKVQLAGPMTCARFGFESATHAVALVRKVSATGATPLVFLDEPALAVADSESLEPLVTAIRTLREEGALVGLHCCGNADWSAVLALDLDVLSFDARLSLAAVCANPSALDDFRRRDGRLCLGVVPTDGVPFSEDAVVRVLQTHLRDEDLRKALLSPACGLGIKTVTDASRIARDLSGLRERLLGFRQG